MLWRGPANRNFGDGWATDSALLFNRGRPDNIFMCCWKPLKTAVELSFQTPCFWLCCRWFWVVFSEVTLFSLDSLFTVFFCQLLRISIRTHQPPVSSQHEVIFTSQKKQKKPHLLSISTPFADVYMNVQAPSLKGCWESALFSCTLGKVKPWAREREWIQTGFIGKIWSLLRSFWIM